MRQWRLIYDSPTDGATHMAVDEAILGAVSSGDVPPTLRLYKWQPFCLSLGYAQKSADADLKRIEAAGWHLVRRPTGGRAILHGDELTYSVALPIHHPLAQGTVVESYRRISRALIAALELLGVRSEAEKQQAASGKQLGPVCFEVPSHYEITAQGRKLIGSAQLRRQHGILQHGSLPLVGDITRICAALAYPDEEQREQAKAQVRARAITLETALGRNISWEQAGDALVEGFARTFDLQLVRGELSAKEHERVTHLLETVYRHPDWTHKR